MKTKVLITINNILRLKKVFTKIFNEQKEFRHRMYIVVVLKMYNIIPCYIYF